MQHCISHIIIILFLYYGALFRALRPPVEAFFNSPVLTNIKIQLEPPNLRHWYAPPMFSIGTKWLSGAVPRLKLHYLPLDSTNFTVENVHMGGKIM